MAAPPPLLQGILAGMLPVAFGKPASYTIPAVVTAGIYVQAGLPNITGNTAIGVGYKAGTNTTPSGAFYKSEALGKSMYGWDDYMGAALFDASRSNNIYGKSTTVQPATLTTCYYIKY